jgi:hypothetical protein
MNTPGSNPDQTPDTPDAVAPRTSKTMKAVVGALVISTAALAGYVIKTDRSQNATPVTTTSANGGKTDTAATSDSGTADSAPKGQKNKSGEEQNNTTNLSFENFRINEMKNSLPRKLGNSGGNVEYLSFGEHGFMMLDGQEKNTTTYPNGQCNQICGDMTPAEIAEYKRINEEVGSNKNKKYDLRDVTTMSFHFEDPRCNKPSVRYPTAHRALGLDSAGVTSITYTDNDGEESQVAPFNTTKHVNATVEPGKSCADLSHGVNNTGRGNVSIASNGPTRVEFDGLSDRVGQIETKVEEHSSTLSTLMDAYQNAPKAACSPDQPDSEICRQARKAVRGNVANDAKARAEKK